MYEQIVAKLNHPEKEERLAALRELKKLIDEGKLEKPQQNGSVNNHIYTTYSFSPYSPSMALWKAYNAGLVTAGIMDHDSISGAREFIEAGEIIGMATTIGFECRVSFASQEILRGRRVNNPDQDTVAYVTMHGIPHTMIDKAEAFLAPYREKRNMRNRKMTAKLNELLAVGNIVLDFDKDILPLSMAHDGGSVTERHISFAAAKKLCETYGKGEKLVAFIKDTLGMKISGKNEAYLMDSENPHYEYDLLGAIKSEYVPKFYIDATDECPSYEEYLAFGKEIGAITAYAYLGDVGDSVTGDKKTQKFEDDFLDELFVILEKGGFNAVTYMPSRNTLAQLARVRALADKHGFFEISGEDINSPRQKFICEALERPEFAHLFAATWALIGHEKAATEKLEDGMFSDKTKALYPDMAKRTEHFAEIGRK